jgi:cobalamin biosynthesis Mg chelatase CobN
MHRRLFALLALSGSITLASPAFAADAGDDADETAADSATDTATTTDTGTASDTSTTGDTSSAKDTSTTSDTSSSADTSAPAADTEPPIDGGPTDAVAEGSGCAMQAGTRASDLGALSLGALVVTGIALARRRRSR